MYLLLGLVKAGMTGGTFQPGTLATIETTASHETRTSGMLVNLTATERAGISERQRFRGQSGLATSHHLTGARQKLGSVMRVRANLVHATPDGRPTGIGLRPRRGGRNMVHQLTEMAVLHGRGLLSVRADPTPGQPGSPRFPHLRQPLPHRAPRKGPRSTQSAHESSKPTGPRSLTLRELR